LEESRGLGSLRLARLCHIGWRGTFLLMLACMILSQRAADGASFFLHLTETNTSLSDGLEASQIGRILVFEKFEALLKFRQHVGS
jgi:hypothetical protein